MIHRLAICVLVAAYGLAGGLGHALHLLVGCSGHEHLHVGTASVEQHPPAHDCRAHGHVHHRAHQGPHAPSGRHHAEQAQRLAGELATARTAPSAQDDGCSHEHEPGGTPGEHAHDDCAICVYLAHAQAPLEAAPATDWSALPIAPISAERDEAPHLEPHALAQPRAPPPRAAAC